MRKLLVCALLFGCACATPADQRNVLDQTTTAYTVQLKATLRNAAVAQETHFSMNGSYTTDVEALKELGLTYEPSISVIVPRADASTYCVEAARDSQVLHMASRAAPEQGPC